MLKDKVLVGAIIGVLANIIKLTFNYTAYLFGFTNVVFWQIVASRFLEKEDIFTPSAYLIGATADFTVTTALGIVFIYVLDFIGKENLWLRGVGMGLATWVFLFGSLLGQSAIHQEPSGIIVTLFAHLLYGLGLAVFTGLYFQLLKKAKTVSKSSFSFAPQPARKVKVFHIKNGIEHENGNNKAKKQDKIEKFKRPKKI
ncbi:MAG: DUF6789 family protein [Dehalobacterium sp.]